MTATSNGVSTRSLPTIARRDVVEDVAAVLHQSRDEVAVDGLGGNLDVRVVRDADVRAGLREAERSRRDR